MKRVFKAWWLYIKWNHQTIIGFWVICIEHKLELKMKGSFSMQQLRKLTSKNRNNNEISRIYSDLCDSAILYKINILVGPYTNRGHRMLHENKLLSRVTHFGKTILWQYYCWRFQWKVSNAGCEKMKKKKKIIFKLSYIKSIISPQFK